MPEYDRPNVGVLVEFVVVRLELGPHFVYWKVLAVKGGISAQGDVPDWH